MRVRHRLFSKKKLTHPAASPGILIEPEGAVEPVITLLAYDHTNIIEKTIETPEEIAPLLSQFPVVWVNVDGLGDVDVLDRLGAVFRLHPLALEDVLNTHHRPKAEEYDNNVFIVARMAAVRDDAFDMEQVSLFLGDNYVVSFQERPGDCLESVRQRIRNGGRRGRFVKPDYLAYALIDAIVDGYFPVLEHFNETLNDIEDAVVENPERNVIEQTHDLKRDLQVLRHGIWPLRETLRKLYADVPWILDETKPFVRDCHDHVIQIADILETYRERGAALTELYLSSLSYKMNEIMKVLTIIATIFIPLSFITGVYGMNFDPQASPLNMPELHWYFGYPAALGVMLLVAGGLVYYFRRKGWIGGRR
ncbi:MAG: magnesium/cobalt transporter CorA [Arenicellales bacterium]